MMLIDKKLKRLLKLSASEQHTLSEVELRKHQEEWLKIIGNVIQSICDNNQKSSIPFFIQSPSHLLIALFSLKYYFEKKNLYKTELINLIIANNNRSKTLLSENKYIDNCIHKGFLILKPSTQDKRKKILIPSQQMIEELKDWLIKIIII